MIIQDLFSHKIHSSKAIWADKLIDLAFVFAEFDRKPYDRRQLEERLSKISPRASSVARDPSKFRDEISAYPAYLGLYRVELIDNKWHFVLSDTAKKFLVIEEPNVPAFMILQLLLFQYPNGMGVVYKSNSDSAWMQANTRDRTLNFIDSGIRLSPLRLICKAIEAKSILKSKTFYNVNVTPDEIFALANNSRVNSYISPDIKLVVEVLRNFEKGKISAPDDYENRFHILKHTNFIDPKRKSISIRSPINEQDKIDLKEKFNLINSIDKYFYGFDDAESSNDLVEPIFDVRWGNYFDGIKTLNSNHVEILTSERGLLDKTGVDEKGIDKKKSKPKVYSFRKRNPTSKGFQNSDNSNKADPEVTKIKRQRSNLIHKILLQQLEEYLESLGCSPVENDHIDLFAKIPDDGKYIFEVKSISNENLLSQTRKGLSQLYEYRYRYQDEVGYDVNLCLVIPNQPHELDWLSDYLIEDRKIGIIWFDKNGQIRTSSNGGKIIQPLFKN